MNKDIEKELKKVVGVELPEYENVYEIIISKKTVLELEEGNCYLIEIADYVLNPPPDFTLHANWNKNTKPVDKTLSVEVTKVAGKMILVNSFGYDLSINKTNNNFWQGWLPRKSIKIIKKL